MMVKYKTPLTEEKASVFPKTALPACLWHIILDLLRDWQDGKEGKKERTRLPAREEPPALPK